MIDRRKLLLGAGLGSAAVLAPFVALERAAAQVKIPTQDDMMADAHHMDNMASVLGPELMGSEQIAMLLYPEFTSLDLVGPYYFFASMFGAKVHLVTTESTLAPVVSDLGLAILPTTTMADCPKDLDLIFVPGGTEGTLNVMTNKAAIAFIADRASRAKHITSVCTGSMILGKAGLLKGKRATSHWAARAALADFGATPVEARVVTDGNVTTGAGVSAGLDFGIAIVAALRGKAYAQSLMLIAEYHPEPPFPGGTLATTPADIGGMTSEMFSPLEDKFRAIAKAD
jgi:cyclohexyl-isocyanide hydratase